VPPENGASVAVVPSFVQTKRIDRRHIERIARRAIAARLVIQDPARSITVETRGDGVLLHCNSGGNALAVEVALRNRGYYVTDAEAPGGPGVALLVPSQSCDLLPPGRSS
jgi:hypothetical protein